MPLTEIEGLEATLHQALLSVCAGMAGAHQRGWASWLLS